MENIRSQVSTMNLGYHRQIISRFSYTGTYMDICQNCSPHDYCPLHWQLSSLYITLLRTTKNIYEQTT